MSMKLLWWGAGNAPAIVGVDVIAATDASAVGVALRNHDFDAVLVERSLADAECAQLLEARAPRAVRLVANGDGAPPFEGGLRDAASAVELGVAVGAARAHRTLPALDDGTTVAGRLARALVHDVNNPLTVVMSSLELLREARGRAPLSDDDSALVDEAMAAALRIQELVSAHRTLARDLPEHRAPLSFTRVVERAILLTAREFQDTVRIAATLDATPDVMADETRLLRSIATLLFVVRAAALQGSVRLTTTSERDRAVLELRYAGRALLPEEKRPIVALVEKLGGAWSHGGHPAERTILIVLPPAG